MKKNTIFRDYTRESIFISSEKFITQAALVTAGAGILAACGGKLGGNNSTSTESNGTAGITPIAGAQNG